LVSSSLYDAGEQHITIVVRALPPRLSWRIRVNLLSRYGTYVYNSQQSNTIIIIIIIIIVIYCINFEQIRMTTMK